MITEPNILAAALEGLEAKLARLNAMIARIKWQGTAKTPRKVAPIESTLTGRRRKELSPESRQRMADAQKKRWAVARKG